MANRAAANDSRDLIKSMISGQAAQMLTTGTGPQDKFDQIRERHIWSKFHVTSGYAGSLINAAGLFNPAAGPLSFFAAGSGQNGQGLPAGFTLDDLDTNFPGQNRVADDHNFIIKEIGVTVEAPRQDVVAASTGAMVGGTPSLNDVDQVLENGIIKVKYLTNEVIYGPLTQFAQPGGVMLAGPSLNDSASANPANAQQVLGGQAETSARQDRWAENSGPIPAMPKLRRQLDVPIFLPSRQTFNFRIFFPRTVQLNTLAQGGVGGFTIRIDWWAIESFREKG